MILEYLDERKQKVLEIIIEDYVDSAEPVGSRTVTEKHHLEASPATVRFDMAELEKKGFIKKPHTSAGRIPSDKGYRFFIDNLMKETELTRREAEHIRENICKAQEESFLSLVSELLSQMCGNTSIVVSPEKGEHISISGISRMIRQPEFSFPERLFDIVEAIEKHTGMIDMLGEYIDDCRDIVIRVGSENNIRSMKNCSVAAAPYKDKGIISVIGPTRMHYEKVASILRRVADLLEETDL